jgi:hypothetical protein
LNKLLKKSACVADCAFVGRLLEDRCKLNILPGRRLIRSEAKIHFRTTKWGNPKPTSIKVTIECPNCFPGCPSRRSLDKRLKAKPEFVYPESTAPMLTRPSGSGDRAKKTPVTETLVSR